MLLVPCWHRLSASSLLPAAQRVPVSTPLLCVQQVQRLLLNLLLRRRRRQHVQLLLLLLRRLLQPCWCRPGCIAAVICSCRMCCRMCCRRCRCCCCCTRCICCLLILPLLLVLLRPLQVALPQTHLFIPLPPRRRGFSSSRCCWHLNRLLCPSHLLQLLALQLVPQLPRRRCLCAPLLLALALLLHARCAGVRGRRALAARLWPDAGDKLQQALPAASGARTCMGERRQAGTRQSAG